MILKKRRDWETDATWYMVAQRYIGWHKFAAMMIMSDELPRSIVAQELCRMRRQVRVNIARTERKRLKAQRRRT